MTKKNKTTKTVYLYYLFQVIVPKVKGESLGVVIVESGWGSMVPTVVVANMAPTGPAARCGMMNIGDQIISVNGVSLVGLPLSSCQNYIKVNVWMNKYLIAASINYAIAMKIYWEQYIIRKQVTLNNKIWSDWPCRFSISHRNMLIINDINHWRLVQDILYFE